MTPARNVFTTVRALGIGLAVTCAAATSAVAQRAAPAVTRASMNSSRVGGARTQFTVRIENVSTPATLQLSSGSTAPAPTSPGVWAVHTGRNPIFVDGRPEGGMGLERQAEEGNPADIAAAVARAKGVVTSGTFAIPVGDSAAGPLLPGKAYELTFDAKPGDKLSLAFMFAQSNDLFYAPAGAGLELFRDGKPVSGDITAALYLWDAGTEVNEEPGLGPSQAPRQAAPNTGTSERRPVARVSDEYTYPATRDVVRVILSATPASASRM